MIGFASPWILAGLAALAVPLLIHLIRRERAEALRFPSIRFITPSRLPREGRRRPSDLLLMLLRMLLLALLVLTLAGMEWVPRADPAGGGAGGRQQVVVLVDVSASMAAGERWAHAVEAVTAYVRTLPRNARVSLILWGRDARLLVHDQPPAAIDMRALAPGLEEGRPATALRMALDLLTEDGPGRLLIVSDFQATNWAHADLPVIASEVDIDWIDVAGDGFANSGIISARVFPAGEDRLRVIARLRNFGPDAVTAVLRLEDAVSDPVRLEPDQSQQVSLLVKGAPERRGMLTLEVDGADAYAADDHYAVWLGAPPPVRVLTLLPLVEEPAKAIEADFVRRALEVGEASGRPVFRLLAGDISEPIPTAPDTIRILYLPGSAAYLDEAQWQRLVSFVAHGGLVFTTPGQAAPVQFRRFREYELSRTEYVGRPGRHRDRFNPYRAQRPQRDSALGAVFDAESGRDLALTQIYQYVRLRTDADTEILLVSEDGDPLLLRERMGGGTVVTSAFGFDAAWTDLPLRNAFLPILREILEEAAPSGGGVVHVHIGEPLPAGWVAADMDPAAPAGTEPAAFKVGEVPVQVNVARAESDPQGSVLGDLQAEVRQHAPAAARPSAADSGVQRAAVPLWPYLAAAALLLFGIECILASRSHRAPVASARHA